MTDWQDRPELPVRYAGGESSGPVTAVYLYFLESGREVYIVESFGDRWAAECYLAGCEGHVWRGGRRVPLTRARIVEEWA